MGARDNIQRLIDRKQQEIADLEDQLREAKVYIQALMDGMKALPRESSSGDGASAEAALRPGSIVYKTRDALRKAGKPLHINDILKILGRPEDKNNRVSVSGTLAAYVRDGLVFKRTAPNTFALVEMEVPAESETISELPETFGG